MEPIPDLASDQILVFLSKPGLRNQNEAQMEEMTTLYPVVERTWGLHEANPPMNREELEGRIAHKVQEMLETDFHGLLTLLYRIDVPYAQLEAAMDGCSLDGAAARLATAIVDRELQKAETRRIHRAYLREQENRQTGA